MQRSQARRFNKLLSIKRKQIDTNSNQETFEVHVWHYVEVFCNILMTHFYDSMQMQMGKLANER